MKDTLYFTTQEDYDLAWRLIFTRFIDDVDITDSSDEVHEYKFDVELTDSIQHSYSKFLIDENLDGNSFMFTKLRLTGKLDSSRLLNKFNP